MADETARPRSCQTCHSLGAPRSVTDPATGRLAICLDPWHDDVPSWAPSPSTPDLSWLDDLTAMSRRAAEAKFGAAFTDTTTTDVQGALITVASLPPGADPDRGHAEPPVDQARWIDQLAAASRRAAEAKFGPRFGTPSDVAPPTDGVDVTARTLDLLREGAGEPVHRWIGVLSRRLAEEEARTALLRRQVADLEQAADAVRAAVMAVHDDLDPEGGAHIGLRLLLREALHATGGA